MAKRSARASDETPPFERVQALVRRIPRGKVATYGQLSRLIDGRLTPVGVGWAIRAAAEGTIPWQRVVGAHGRISTEREHPGLQREMLESEGVRFDAEGRVDLERHGWDPQERSPAEGADAPVSRRRAASARPPRSRSRRGARAAARPRSRGSAD